MALIEFQRLVLQSTVDFSIFIIRASYLSMNNTEHIYHLINFIKESSDDHVIITGFKTLYTSMDEDKMLDVKYYLPLLHEIVSFNHNKSIRYYDAYEGMMELKTISDKILLIIQMLVKYWTIKIIDGNTTDIIDFLNSKENYLSLIITWIPTFVLETYEENIQHFDKICDFITLCSTIMGNKVYGELFEQMMVNNDFYSTRAIKLAYLIEYNNGKKTLFYYRNINGSFPKHVIDLVKCNNSITIPSTFRNSIITVDVNEFMVFTDLENKCKDYSKWKIIAKDHYTKFLIKNTMTNNHLYSLGNNLYDKNRRNIYATSSIDKVDSAYWEITPKPNGFFVIKNLFYGEYIYAANYFDYQNLFTDAPKPYYDFKMGKIFT